MAWARLGRMAVALLPAQLLHYIAPLPGVVQDLRRDDERALVVRDAVAGQVVAKVSGRAAGLALP
jgi:hypothetical protein